MSLAALLILACLMACTGQPSGQTTPPPAPPAPVQEPVLPETPSPEDFDPATISQEVFESTKIDVQKLIEDLNRIIRAGDYNAWVAQLSEAYFETICSPEFLARTSDSTRLKQQRIVLASPEDYFTHVVVPSRANDRVDDIEFTGQNRVKAYTLTPRGQRLRLYELEKTGDSWKIMN